MGAEYAQVKNDSCKPLHVSRSRKSYVLSIGLLVRSITRQKDLFLDDRRQVLAGVTKACWSIWRKPTAKFTVRNQRLMEYLRELNVPLPQGFSLVRDFLSTAPLPVPWPMWCKRERRRGAGRDLG